MQDEMEMQDGVSWTGVGVSCPRNLKFQSRLDHKSLRTVACPRHPTVGIVIRQAYGYPNRTKYICLDFRLRSTGTQISRMVGGSHSADTRFKMPQSEAPRSWMVRGSSCKTLVRTTCSRSHSSPGMDLGLARSWRHFSLWYDAFKTKDCEELICPLELHGIDSEFSLMSA
jgi:hypothetical protein